MFNTKWTKKEIAIIKKLYPKDGTTGVIVLIDRTNRAIEAKARRLKLMIKPNLNIYHTNTPNTLKAYFAGHFDGEGCIHFRKAGKCFSPQMSASGSNLETIELYKKYFNGHIRLKRNEKGYKKIFVWQCDRFNDIYNFCLAISHFSIEKKKQLQLGIDHMKEWESMGNIRNPTNKFRKHSLERANKCKDLKHL